MWLYLAEAEQKAGVKITDAQLEDMRKNLFSIDFAYASQKEKELRHDVMAHIHAFAKAAPKAAGIIHLGVTSAYVGDNTDLMQYRSALELVKQKILEVIHHLKEFAVKFKKEPTLAYTHFQVAQPTTVGKRACLWLQDLLFDYHQVKKQISDLPFRGVKGTTGSQASIMKLVNGDQRKVKMIEKHICQRVGFKKLLALTGQTYTRKIDSYITSLLSQVAQSAAKFANDLRLLSHLKEVEEPFEKNQVGSSAMPYKRNPIRSERINSLARFVITLANSTAHTSSTQWLERTLDDSANKRLALPECFLAVDAVLDIYRNVSKNLNVNLEVIEKNFAQSLPFIILENVLMDKVEAGSDRQQLHEAMRRNSLKALTMMKNGQKNPLLNLIAQDKTINISLSELKQRQDPNLYLGRNVQMIDEFMEEEVNPILKHYRPLGDSLIKV